MYAWHYCYYDERNRENLEVAFGAYQAVYDEDELEKYYLRSGSYYLLHLDRRKNKFTCDNVTLAESEYFHIYEDDRVGACLRDSGEIEFLDILAEGNYRVGRWGSNSGHCREKNMLQSSGGLETTSVGILHLYVDISK